MKKTFEQLKQEAIARGIKPGAKVKVPYLDDVIYTVQPFDCWKYEPSYGLRAAINDIGNDQVFVFIRGDWATIITPASEDQQQGLVDGMACEPDEHMRRAIVEKAKELGFTNGIGHNQAKSLVYRDGKGQMSLLNNAKKNEGTWITPGEFYDRLCRTVKPEPPICIGDHEVKFRKGEIMVGCMTISNHIVRKIAKQLKD